MTQAPVQIAHDGVLLEATLSTDLPVAVGAKPVYVLNVALSGGGGGGGGGGAPVAPANIGVAPGTIANNQVAMTAVAANIFPARTGAPGTGRVSGLVYNLGLNTVYLGATGVTAATGVPLLPGGSATVDTTAALQGICAATLTSTVAFMEAF